MQLCANIANCRFDHMLSDAYTSDVRQCSDQTDSSVTAHAEIANVVKENDARGVR
jgi:hypothetical protein